MRLPPTGWSTKWTPVWSPSAGALMYVRGLAPPPPPHPPPLTPLRPEPLLFQVGTLNPKAQTLNPKPLDKGHQACCAPCCH